LPRRLAASSKDVQQLARVKLLVRQGAALPKIADYAGRGDLGSWVSVLALRIAVSLTRTQKREVELDDDRRLFDLAEGDDAEVALSRCATAPSSPRRSSMPSPS
jgi:RNA polymerase sigma-70 factor (ECF subfamily)